MKLNQSSATEFTKRLEGDVIPLLRQQKGFLHEIAFATPEGKEAFGISLWDRKEDAEAYDQGDYGKVNQMLEKVIDGKAHVEGFEVSTSTFAEQTVAAKH
jgi:hypothetical protein